MNFQESLRAYRSQVTIICPRMKSLASNLVRNSSGVSAMDVMRVVKQAMSTSEAFMAKPVTNMMRAGKRSLVISYHLTNF